MTGATISRETGELLLRLLEAERRRCRINGVMPPHSWLTAMVEVTAVVERAPRGTLLPGSGDGGAPSKGVPRRSDAELTVSVSADRLGVTPRAIRARCERGSIEARKVGRDWMITWPIKKMRRTAA